MIEEKIINNLEITKFLDVKTPIGIEQRGEIPTNYSVGVDLYLPNINNQFIQAILESNKDGNNKSKLIWEEELSAFFTAEHKLKAIVIRTHPEGKCLEIYQPVQIPTGIAILLPNNCYATVESKSSNFKNGYTIVTGKIDMNYTYGMGVQLIPINYYENTPGGVSHNISGYQHFTISENQKFCQLLIHQAVPVLNICEISQKNWNKNQIVIERRNIRKGGFGSTGKFENS